MRTAQILRLGVLEVAPANRRSRLATLATQAIRPPSVQSPRVHVRPQDAPSGTLSTQVTLQRIHATLDDLDSPHMTSIDRTRRLAQRREPCTLAKGTTEKRLRPACRNRLHAHILPPERYSKWHNEAIFSGRMRMSSQVPLRACVRRQRIVCHSLESGMTNVMPTSRGSRVSCGSLPSLGPCTPAILRNASREHRSEMQMS